MARGSVFGLLFGCHPDWCHTISQCRQGLRMVACAATRLWPIAFGCGDLLHRRRGGYGLAHRFWHRTKFGSPLQPDSSTVGNWSFLVYRWPIACDMAANGFTWLARALPGYLVGNDVVHPLHLFHSIRQHLRLSHRLAWATSQRRISLL